jgi:hypothetical protein
MSNIDTKIEEHKRMLADLEKQKKHEEEYKNTIDWNMEQLDKYVESIERIVQDTENNLKIKYNKPEINDNQLKFIISNETTRIRCELYKTLIYRYKEDGEEIKILYDDSYYGHKSLMYKAKPKYYNHIFEFIYKILKYLFTSNKKLSNDNDSVKERLNTLENYDIKNKLDIIEDRLDRIDIVRESIVSKLSDYNEIREKVNLLENENKYLKEKLYDLI